jgi:hypothetical protein
MPLPDAPELILRREVAGLLNGWELAVYSPGSTVPVPRMIRLDGVMPTMVDDFTLMTSLTTTYEGRANANYRIQFHTRRKGSPLVLEQWASELNRRLHMAEYTPTILGISLARETSRLPFDPDSQGRSAVACTYTFRGRRVTG